MLSSHRLWPCSCNLSVGLMAALQTNNGHARDPCEGPATGSRWKQATMAEIEIFPDKDALIRAGAEGFVAAAAEAVRARGRCLVALSGGSTPKPLYELLASPSHAT